MSTALVVTAGAERTGRTRVRETADHGLRAGRGGSGRSARPPAPVAPMRRRARCPTRWRRRSPTIWSCHWRIDPLFAVLDDPLLCCLGLRGGLLCSFPPQRHPLPAAPPPDCPPRHRPCFSGRPLTASNGPQSLRPDSESSHCWRLRPFRSPRPRYQCHPDRLRQAGKPARPSPEQTVDYPIRQAAAAPHSTSTSTTTIFTAPTAAAGSSAPRELGRNRIPPSTTCWNPTLRLRSPSHELDHSIIGRIALTSIHQSGSVSIATPLFQNHRPLLISASNPGRADAQNSRCGRCRRVCRGFHARSVNIRKSPAPPIFSRSTARSKP